MDKDMDDFDQEVTVEVIPQTVTKIIYLSEEAETETDKTDSNSYVQWEDEEDCEEPADDQLYEIGSVDIEENNQYTINRQLILDETQSYVLLSQDGMEELGNMQEYINLNTVYLDNIDGNNDPVNIALPNESLDESDKDKHKGTPRIAPKKYAQAFLHNNNLTEMVPFVPQTKITKFTCDKCGSVLKNGVDLLEHKKSHGTTMLYACNKCDAEFSSTAEVSTHLRMQHSKKKSDSLLLSRPVKYVPVQKRHFLLSGKNVGRNGNGTKKCKKK